MRASLVIAVAAVGTIACGDQAPTTTGALTLDPPSASSPAGRGVRFTPHLLDGDVELELPAAPTWQVRDPLIAEVRTIDGEVVVVGRAPGSTVVSAWLDGQEARAALTVRAAEPESLELVPPHAAVVSGDCVSFTASVRYTDDRVVPVAGTDIAWGGDPMLQPDGRGAYCPFGTEGTFTIRGSYRGLLGSAQLDVAFAPVTDLIVFGPTDLPVGTDPFFNVEASFADGALLQVSDRTTWTSSDPAVLTAPIAGHAHAIALGTTTLTVMFGGFSRTLDVEVRLPRVTFLLVGPSTTTLAVGATAALHATGFFDDNQQRDVTATATWSATPPDRATVDGGVVTALAPGTASIRAELDGVGSFASVQVVP